MPNSVWYTSPLTCLRCRETTAARESRLHSDALNPEPGDGWLAPGDVLDAGLPDLADAFVPTARWPPKGRLLALEGWTCLACGSDQVALVQFEDMGAPGWRLLSVQTVTMTPELLSRVHGVSERQREIMGPAQLALLNPG